MCQILLCEEQGRSLPSLPVPRLQHLQATVAASSTSAATPPSPAAHTIASQGMRLWPAGRLQVRKMQYLLQAHAQAGSLQPMPVQIVLVLLEPAEAAGFNAPTARAYSAGPLCRGLAACHKEGQHVDQEDSGSSERVSRRCEGSGRRGEANGELLCRAGTCADALACFRERANVPLRRGARLGSPLHPPSYGRLSEGHVLAVVQGIRLR